MAARVRAGWVDASAAETPAVEEEAH
jgi:hypothetical protein